MSFVQGTIALEGDTTLQAIPVVIAPATVSLQGSAVLQVNPRVTMLMILQGGPLDGEHQIVESLPNAPGSTMFFSIPTYQFFDQGGNVVDRGLEVTYSYLSPGPPPDDYDTWNASYIFNFVGEEVYIPPGGLYPTVAVLQPNRAPANSATVFQMAGNGLLTLTNVYMPLPAEANNARPATSFHVTDDSSATVHAPGQPGGLYDLSLAYAGGYTRYAAAFRFV
jgi:hypothetical protein